MDSMEVLKCAQEGNVEKLKELLKEPDENTDLNVDLNVQDVNYGQTPIIWASENGHKAIVNLLLERGADVEATDKWSQGPLHWAAWNGHLNIVELLLEKKPKIDQQNSTGQTPISFAAEAGHEKIVELLLVHGADVEINDEVSQGPLHWAAKKGKFEVVRLLLENEKIRQHLDDRESEYGQTSLSLAAEEGHKEVVKLLLESGADEKLPDFAQRLPLNFAAMEDRIEVVSLLLNRITEVSYIDPTGRSLLSWAVEYPIPSFDVKTLLEHHQIGSLDNRNRAAIHYAARGGLIESLNLLLEGGAKHDEADIFGHTPLSMAAKKGHLELVQRLCEIQSDISSQDNDGDTPLACAIIYGHSQVVQELIKAHSDLYSKNFRGETPVFLAIVARKPEILEAIIKHEYKPTSKTSELPGQEIYIRTRAVEEALCYCLSHEADKDIVSTIKHYLNARDLEGRSVVSWAVERGDIAVLEDLTDEKMHWDAADNHDRTPLSWAAASENKDARKIVQFLLQKDARIDAPDSNLRTPLSWASENGNEGAVEELLEKKATADWEDSDGRTPLSIAAEKGHLAVVDRLLDLASIKIKPTHKSPKERTSRKQKQDEKISEKKVEVKKLKVSKSQEIPEGPTKGSHGDIRDRHCVDVNSQDKSCRTPLYYAATSNHAQVVEVLLECGADVETSRETKTLQDHPDVDRRVMDILESKRNDGQLATERLASSDVVDDEFRALVVHFQAKNESELRSDTPKVQELLDNGDTVPKDAILSCKWLHLPANNMRWVEILMTKHYGEAGPEHQTLHRNVLNKNWTGHQHRTHKPWPYHSRFMRPDCQLLSPLSKKQARAATTKDMLTEAGNANTSTKDAKENPLQARAKTKENGPKTRKPDGTPPSQGFVLFMPYLHWERKDELQKLKKIMEEKEKRLKANKAKSSLGYEETSIREAIKDIEESEKRLKANEAKSSLGYEETTEKNPQAELNGTEKMYWMYLDQQHPLHPRRTLDQYYYYTLDDTSDRDGDQTASRYYNRKQQGVDDKIKEVLTMVDQLWMWVLPPCGQLPCTVITAFPQRSNRIITGRTKRTTALIDNIMSTCSNMPPRHGYDLARIIAAECGRIYLDRTSRRDDSIQFYDIYSSSIADLTHKETKQFQGFQQAIDDSKKLNQKSRANLSDEKVGRGKILKQLVNIEQDIKNLKEIKDIQDELNIMLTVFTTQQNVIRTMHRIVESQGKLTKKGVNQKSMVDDRLGHSSPLAVVQNNLREVKNLMSFAQKTSEAIKQLLDLKNKQANVLEEETTNHLNEQILKLNKKTDRQGATLMAFTVITIVFLPLSFMTSFFALNIAEFPRSGPSQMLSISFVSKYTFTISLAFAIGFTILALNMRRIGSALGKALKGPMQSITDFLKKARGRRSKTGDVENPASTEVNPPTDKDGCDKN